MIIVKEEPIEEEEEKVSLFKYHRPEDPIPTVDDWTPKQVADYFSERFGCVVGNAFLSQVCLILTFRLNFFNAIVSYF